jgi:hypothetical protein
MPRMTLLVTPQNQVVYLCRFVGVQGQCGMPPVSECGRVDFSGQDGSATVSVCYDNKGTFSEPEFS